MKEKKIGNGTSSEYIPCSIKQLPDEQLVQAAQKAIEINPRNGPPMHLLQKAFPAQLLEPQHLAVLTSKYWGEGGVRLTVGFMDNPEAALRARILSHMNAWGQYGNIQFVESNLNPQVRINRGAGGYWSYLGTDILQIPSNQPTMNLQGFTMNTADSEFYRVVRHETGHTLGFPHEHLRAEIINGIDRERAIALFMATQGWTRQQVINQVLTPISESALIATAHADPNSIMCYGLPGSIMLNGQPVPGGRDINALDAQLAALVYPKSSDGLFSTYFTWRGTGVAKINIPDARIRSTSVVLAAISEYVNNPRQDRFIGAAKMGVYNIAPYNGGVSIWIEVNWNSALPVCIDLIVRP
jgi:hypothetical protein